MSVAHVHAPACLKQSLGALGARPRLSAGIGRPGVRWPPEAWVLEGRSLDSWPPPPGAPRPGAGRPWASPERREHTGRGAGTALV